MKNILEYLKHPKKYWLTIVLGIIVIFLGYRAMNQDSKILKVDYLSRHSETAVTVNGEKLTFKDMAFYIAYEEMLVEKQAELYNPDDTAKYWNLHIDGEFVRITARQSAMSMAIHDEIFYQMALEEGISLTDQDMVELENNQDDFWSDFADLDGDEKLGVTREDIDSTMEKIAIAQKYQAIYAQLQGADYEDYDFSGELYDSLLEENNYKINKNVWEKLDFGNIILSH